MIDVGQLKAKTAEIAERAGVPPADAAMIADVLVTADARGISSHGVVRLARYIDCIRAGGIKPAAELEILRESPNSLMVSAAGGLGIPAAVKTMELTVDSPVRDSFNTAQRFMNVRSEGAPTASIGKVLSANVPGE